MHYKEYDLQKKHLIMDVTIAGRVWNDPTEVSNRSDMWTLLAPMMIIEVCFSFHLTK